MDDTSESDISSMLPEQAIAYSVLFASLSGISLTESEARNLRMVLPDNYRTISSRPLAKKWGMLFLHDREELVRHRFERYRYSLRKWKRVRRIATLFAHIPFVRSIMVCNTLSFEASRDESDIDLFIVSAKGWVWWTRACTLALLSLLRLRPGQRRSLKDTICTCFFAGEQALDFSSLQLEKKNGMPDMYLCWWIAQCAPVYDEHTYENFVRANAWTREHMPHWTLKTLCEKRTVRLSGASTGMKRCVEWILMPVRAHIEPMCRSIQEKMMPKGLRDASHKGGTSVVCSDSIIKLHHPHDLRDEIRSRFAELIRCHE